MKLRNSLPLYLRVIALSLPLLTTSLAATRTWDGGPSGTGTDINTAANWSGDTLPVSDDTAQWNGTATGVQNLNYATNFISGGTNVVNFNLTSGQTSAVNINTTTAGGEGAGGTLRLNTLTVASGAGALTIGNLNTGKVNIFLGTSNTNIATYTNNSTSAVTLGSNIQVITTGGNFARTWAFGGAGDFDIAAPIAQSVYYQSSVATSTTGRLTLTKAGAGTLTISNAVNTYGGAINITGGTLRAASNTALGWGTTVFSLTNNAANAVQSTTVGAAGTLDLFNGRTINEVINLTSGGSLINSQAGSTSVLDNGLAGITLNTNGSGYTGNNNIAVSLTGGGGSGATATAYAGNGTAPNPSGLPNAVANTGTNGVVNSVTLTGAGSGYTSAPTVTITSGSSNATATAVLSSLALTGTTNQIGGAGNLQINAVVSGSGGGFEKVGTGTITFTAVNTYTGSTLVSAGTLLVSGTGSINTSSGVTINGGTLRYNSSTNLTAPLTFTSGTLAGTNFAGKTLSIGTNQTISPGNSTGTLASASQTWAGGGTYDWEINDATGTAGANGWDLLNISGDLTITANSGSQFNINVISLSSQVAGQAANFDSLVNGAWLIADATSAISTFDASAFHIDLTQFQNAYNGVWSVALGGSGSFGGDNSQIYLTYSAIPEPSTTLLLTGALMALVLFRRRRA